MRIESSAANDENNLPGDGENIVSKVLKTKQRQGVPGKRKALSEIEGKRRFTRAEANTIALIEREDGRDVNMVVDYSEEIFLGHRDAEKDYRPSPNYMDFQESLKWQMRTILVDWIIDVHFKLNLLSETLHLSVNLIDRFLSIRIVSIGKLQLVGVSALLIASKFEEIVSPSVDTFVILTDRSFTEDEILRAERYMLHSLGYKVNFPSPMNFLRRCSKADCYDPEIRNLAKILLDITLLDEKFLPFLPSVVSCSCMLLARRIHSAEDSELFYHYCAYTYDDLVDCARTLSSILFKPIVHESIFKKYGLEFTKKLERLKEIQL